MSHCSRQNQDIQLLEETDSYLRLSHTTLYYFLYSKKVRNGNEELVAKVCTTVSFFSVPARLNHSPCSTNVKLLSQAVHGVL